jgi:hypothetical protein
MITKEYLALYQGCPQAKHFLDSFWLFQYHGRVFTDRLLESMEYSARENKGGVEALSLVDAEFLKSGS